MTKYIDAVISDGEMEDFHLISMLIAVSIISPDLAPSLASMQITSLVDRCIELSTPGSLSMTEVAPYAIPCLFK